MDYQSEKQQHSLPPILPDLPTQLQDYILNPKNLVIHDYRNAQMLWNRQPQLEYLFRMELSPNPIKLQVCRDPSTGEIIDYYESTVAGGVETAKNSMSLTRAPGAPEDSVLGNPTNFPFWPGGFDQPEPIQLLDNPKLLDFENDLHSAHPDFDHGHDFTSNKSSMSVPSKSVNAQSQSKGKVINLTTLSKEYEDSIGLWMKDEDSDAEKSDIRKSAKTKTVMLKSNTNTEVDIDELITETVPIDPVLKISQTRTVGDRKVREWAELVDVSKPIYNFKELIPTPAFTWLFELDTFQKQAIIHLEKHHNIFVAAHTSAGKTVVAEYAIALSQKHRTRTIYTSPIKALSNQKYRDFRNQFEDVGLLTGDVQIKHTASCLIMTTEILKSMLYNGSDVIRDLEYVIFDEVHYINDSDRGYVWEEVLIMLPDNIVIIMLSATVPNHMDFADWVGRIKKRKIYVMTTHTRPVPLEHYLYTGCGRKTKDQRFLVMDCNNKFLNHGYNGAVNGIEEQQCKSSKTNVPKGKTQPRRIGPNQDVTIWTGLVEHLKGNDLLPVVAFTFSRKACDQNATALKSIDLTSGTEKSRIHSFCNKCIMRLKPEDRQLPQVCAITSLLERGIGIHHSGILPLLKEMVEILFEQKQVKLLFATETFAMGVNMPARTVIFDSITKYDGINFRTLLPGEYIQMAGRAGRRGADKTGTVYIMCKAQVPEHLHLTNMLKGVPTQLDSQFRLTYTLILNTCRDSRLTVEEVMSRSFGEVGFHKTTLTTKDKLKQVEDNLNSMSQVKYLPGYADMVEYYEHANEYLKLKKEIQYIYTNPKVIRIGQVLIVNNGSPKNHLALVLNVNTRGQKKEFDVLVLRDLNSEGIVTNSILNKYICTFQKDVFVVQGIVEHEVIPITFDSVVSVTKQSIKTDAEKVLNDWKQRQIPRFSKNAPGETCKAAVQELIKLSCDAVDNLELIEPISDINIQDLELVTTWDSMKKIKQHLTSLPCVTWPDFREQFDPICKYKYLQEEQKNYQFHLSKKSLNLYPEYQKRINVLKALKYIDEKDNILLKGRVACKMGNHEIMITEVVFQNILIEKPPAEIAALLSALVFQQKASAPNLNTSLTEGVKAMKDIATSIAETQKACEMLEPVGDFVDQFNFGLVEVVYEWANGKPFAEILTLTDVQEGMIVRCIQRLDETLRDVKEAASTIGDPILKEKMEIASTSIKRDIVFAASLYTDENAPKCAENISN